MFEVPKTNQVSNVEFHLKPFKCTGTSQKLTGDYHFKYSPEKSSMIGCFNKNQEQLALQVNLARLEILRDSIYEQWTNKEILTGADSMILTLRRPSRQAWQSGLYNGAPRSHLQAISKRRKMTSLEI